MVKRKSKVEPVESESDASISEEYSEGEPDVDASDLDGIDESSADDENAMSASDSENEGESEINAEEDDEKAVNTHASSKSQVAPSSSASAGPATKKSRGSDLPTKDEQLQLHNTEALMRSNLLKLQVDEMLVEVSCEKDFSLAQLRDVLRALQPVLNFVLDEGGGMDVVPF